ncbi:SCO2400 family protein [Streptomyces endophytica]|uniref:SCO2400 family protein n=1 Tax=Streptomyces endophytica TaxID=2991496 RepID=UPI003C6F79B8
MDYCSSCRRNLNGALVCPGCGDYAPDIAPPAHHRARTGAEAAALWESWQAPEATAAAPTRTPWRRRGRRRLPRPPPRRASRPPRARTSRPPPAPDRAAPRGAASWRGGRSTAAGRWPPPRSRWSAAR